MAEQLCWLLIGCAALAGLLPRVAASQEYGSFDFVIVGAGPSGSALANRLSEVGHWTVLLLEAGQRENFLTDVPLLAPLVQLTDYNWGYRTEPAGANASSQGGGYCLAMRGGRCNWPRGKALGGSSVLNFMLYTRGARADYDGWQALGNPGWSYRDVLPYFLKSERSRLRRQEAAFHADDGYLDVSDVPYVSGLREPFLQAARRFGYSRDVDYNGRNLMGFSPVQANLRGGRRVSAAKAFLQPIRRRRNLHVLTGARATRLLIEARRARGVHFLLQGHEQPQLARARREVLLCAGALNSPQLLLLSGLGPRHELAALGVPVLEHLPAVGRNLQDHVSMAALTFLVNDSLSIVDARLAVDPKATLDYLLRGRGPFTVPGGAEALAFVHTDTVLDGVATSERDYPDVELVLGAGALTGDLSGAMRELLGLSEAFERSVFGRHKGRDAFSIVPIIMRPKSRGRVSLRSADPLQAPLLQPNYYEDSSDLRTMVRGIKAAIAVASGPDFRRLNSTLLPVAFPGCSRLQFASDEYWACAARRVSSSLGHLAGTCRMAPRHRHGVVDARLRVYGVRGLRVVDASIMPEIVAGHTCAPAYMIAEKAADLIKQDWALLPGRRPLYV